ncbi:MAG: acyl-CoA synthetase FdrA [Oligoflexia bacterium]|nr:acyl-CoA synthetase FdrA [Oligoflexia bacterium]
MAFKEGVIQGLIRKGEYYDSVSLMIISKKIREEKGVFDSSVVMCTEENKKNLRDANLFLEEFENAEESDLLVAIRASSASLANELLKKLEKEIKILNKGGDDSDYDSGADPSRAGRRSENCDYKNFEGAYQKGLKEEANLALISVNGKYAGDVALKALNKNMHVMLFSDNVSLETEIELKQLAQQKNLLVMGPDCGTAIIAGVPLAFANEVSRGSIGVLGASGTGMQEVTTLISNFGEGISHAIGTGGRDVKKEVGGISFLMALKMLKEDVQTKVILLVSKPPHKEVMDKIIKEIDKTKSVVAVFLGASDVCNSCDNNNNNIIFRDNLYEGALTAYKIARGEGANIDDEMKKLNEESDKIAKLESEKIKKGAKYLRGLYSGGTFASEAQLILDFNGDSNNDGDNDEELYSNVPTAKSKRLSDVKVSTKNTIIDLGEDEFTLGKPHPMIDYTLRNERFLKEINDPEVAVIMLDYVLGHGSHKDPLSDTISILQKAFDILAKEKRYISILTTVTGTAKDPQNSEKVKEALRREGVIVVDSNFQMSLIAKKVITYGKKHIKG